MIETIWQYRNKNYENVETLCEELNITEVLAKLLINKGYKNVESARKFLYPKLSDMYNPFLMKDMDKAVDRIIKAIKNNERIWVYGDYDVDGVTSTSLMILVLRKLGANVKYYIPNRFTEGYGINKNAIKYIYDNGVDLIISVDCGITAIEEVEYAKELGIDLIITDHHEQGDNIPSAYAVVNPKRKDCQYPYKGLAGVGVAYKVLCGVISKINKYNFDNYLTEFLDIVAFGTVADIVPLKDENRIIVKEGLKLINSNNVKLGIKELINVSGLNDKEISTGHIGFQLAPRINACGRLGDASVGVELLTTDDENKAKEISRFANLQNAERQKIEDKILKDALSMIKPPEEYKDNVIILASKEWNAGIQGIVASKIVEMYHKPVILGTINEENMVHCSGRSIEEFDLFEGLCKCSEYLTKFGGHKQAAGMTFPLENLEPFRNKLNEIIGKELTEDDFKPKIKIDSDINFVDIDFKLYDEIKMLEPFGMGNSEPVLACKNVSLVKDAMKIGKNEKHLKLSLFETGVILDCLFWQKGELADYLKKEDKIDIAFKLSVNEFRGEKKIQIIAQDIKKVKINKTNNHINENIRRYLDDLFENINQKIAKKIYENIDNYYFVTTVKAKCLKNVKIGDNLIPKIEDTKIKLLKETEIVGYLNENISSEIIAYLKMGVDYKFIVAEIFDGKISLLVKRITGSKEMEKNKEKIINKKLNKEKLLFFLKDFFLRNNEFNENNLNVLNDILNNEKALVFLEDFIDETFYKKIIPSFLTLYKNKKTIMICPNDYIVKLEYLNIYEEFRKIGIKIQKAMSDLSTEDKFELWESIRTKDFDVLIATIDFINAYKEELGEYLYDEIELIILNSILDWTFLSKVYLEEYNIINDFIKTTNSKNVLDLFAVKFSESFIKHLPNKTKINVNKKYINFDKTNNKIIFNKNNVINKNKYLKNLIYNSDNKIIIYLNDFKSTLELAKQLQTEFENKKYEIAIYDVELPLEDKNKIKELFEKNYIKIIVASSYIGILDKDCKINHIVYYDLPLDFVDFMTKNKVKKQNNIMKHIIFTKEDIILNNNKKNLIYPNKELLRILYKELKKICLNGSEKEVEISTKTLLIHIKNKYNNIKLNEYTIIKSLKIFNDLKLIKIIKNQQNIKIKFYNQDNKIKLDNSLNYIEMEKNKKRFETYCKYMKTLLNK